MTLEINLLEALSGFVRYVKFLDGNTLKISSHKHTIEPNSQHTIFNEGLRYKSSRGNLIVKFKVDFPKTLVSDHLALETLISQTKKKDTHFSGKVKEVDI
jgi:DnaJ-class molecular chaperone